MSVKIRSVARQFLMSAPVMELGFFALMIVVLNATA